MKILFWNTHKNEKINYILSELIIENNVSIVVLAEYTAPMDELLTYMQGQGKTMFPYISVGCDRIKVIGSIDNIKPGYQSKYTTIQIINNDIILCGIHLPSKIYGGSEKKRDIIIRELIYNIQNTEDDIGTDRTIIVGDFNVNPYESSVIDATLFHGIPICCEANRKTRMIEDKEFRMFYNPMWNFLGDFSEPYGTYYYVSNDTDNLYWNIYDQVLLRPSLRKSFVEKSLTIVTHTSSQYFLDKNKHPNKKISDHLPIIFEIKENNHG
ncbi:MAG: endonuclease/exonuclease/phosphatase [Clostridia bacterium]|nr:endonuclease/exonuclease/phosphatase [Clostridia bacterium]